MLLENFISEFNKEGVIVLLEGKRKVLPEDEQKLEMLGSILAGRMPLTHFRSGNAGGADEFFARGVTAIDSERFHVIIPDSNHRKRQREGITSYSLDDMQLTGEDRVIYESRKHQKTEKLLDRYLSGVRDKTTHYITPIIRDAVKVIGYGAIPPATVALFYDDLSDPENGGTGFTMKTCRDNGVPFFVQRVWFEWLG